MSVLLITPVSSQLSSRVLHFVPPWVLMYRPILRAIIYMTDGDALHPCLSPHFPPSYKGDNQVPLSGKDHHQRLHVAVFAAIHVQGVNKKNRRWVSSKTRYRIANRWNLLSPLYSYFLRLIQLPKSSLPGTPV